jgi:WD40 repeat protein
MSVAFSPDGKTVASAGWIWGAKEEYPVGGELKLWDVAAGKNTATFRSGTSFVHSVAFSPDGKTLASGHASVSQDGNGTIPLWDLPAVKKTKK